MKQIQHKGKFRGNISALCLSLCLVLCLGLAAGQQVGQETVQQAAQGLPEAARAALTQGQQAATAALATYDVHYLDKPLWREAIDYGMTAQRLAPERPEPYRFIGQVYTTVKWYSRAWDAWQNFEQYGGTLNAQTAPYVEEVSAWLGNDSFRDASYENAILYFEKLLSLEPESEEANRYLARSYLALDNPRGAQPYLQTLVESYPDNENYASLLASSERQLTYGVEASQAFEEGLALLAEQPEQALAAFERATGANPNFREAFVQAGRTAQALNRPQVAAGFWQRAVQLGPQDREAQQALTLTQNQGRYGVQAYNAYQRGTAQYAQGQVEAARVSFRQAVDANSRYGDAWGWLGRIALEQERLSDATDFYDRARVLEPTNSTYAQGYQQASAQLEVQTEAERVEAERLEAERLEAERLEAERLAEQQAAEAEAARLAEQEAAEQEAAEQEAAEAEAAARAEQESATNPTGTATNAETSTETSTESNTDTDTATDTEVATPATPSLTTEVVTEVPAETSEPTPQPQPQPQPQRTSAAQVDLLATTYTHQGDRLTGSGAYSFFAAPSSLGSLTAPVDYASGTVHQRLEVLSKPSDEPVRYQLCLVPKNISVKPACSTSELAFSDPGVYESTQPLSSFSNYTSVDWESGIDDVMLVVKDSQGRPVDDAYFVGQRDETLNLDDYFPMQVSFEAVLVPPGANFQGW